jgi:hypothetical protein
LTHHYKKRKQTQLYLIHIHFSSELMLRFLEQLIPLHDNLLKTPSTQTLVIHHSKLVLHLWWPLW